MLAPAQEAGRDDGKRRVLGAADGDLAVEFFYAVDEN